MADDKPDFLATVLPAAPVPASLINPRTLVAYTDYKVGKSAISSWVSLNCNGLWLDLEDGSEALPGVKINVLRKAQELKITPSKLFLDTCKALAAETPRRYDFVLVDKLDNLEDWSEEWATAEYKASVAGRGFKEASVRVLEWGNGYTMIREKFLVYWNAAKAAANHAVFWGTLKKGQEEKKASMDTVENRVASSDIDLIGRTRKVVVGDADATGFMWRETDNSNYLSFVSKEKGSFTGNRLRRLEGRRFRLSWLTPCPACKGEPGKFECPRCAGDGQLVTAEGWKQIFVNGAKAEPAEQK